MPDDSSVAVAGAATETAGIAWEQSHPEKSDVRRVRVIAPAAFSVGTVIAGLRTLTQYSDLLYVLSVFRLSVRYKQSILGWAWAALQPLALMGIYTFVFAHVTRVNTGGTPYSLFVFSGLLPWLFFSSSITNSVHGMIAYPSLLTKMYFPREIIPLSYLTAAVTDFLIASVILAGLLAYYHVAVTWNLLYVVPILFILGAFAAAIALFFSAVHVRFRDIGLALPFVLQIWMFAIPVVYSLQAVPARFRNLYLLDPIAIAIESFRGAVLYGHAPDRHMLAMAAGEMIVALTLAYAYFKSSEATMADVV
ncbi:MAG TPA: ABC transporter permease [Candidatus Sulfotelmatobacter sp.]|nr:ABC transporter permease [Candidatus Sulfotelmatobacter sp.]